MNFNKKYKHTKKPPRLKSKVQPPNVNYQRNPINFSIFSPQGIVKFFMGDAKKPNGLSDYS